MPTARLQLPEAKRFRYPGSMAIPSPVRTAFLAGSVAFTAALLSSCQTEPKNPADWQVPLTLQTFPPAYADKVLEVADKNHDGEVTMVEWTNAGGDQRTFLLADQNRDGKIERTELIRLGSNVQVFDFVRRYSDANKDAQLTPREFRNSSGVTVLRIPTR